MRERLIKALRIELDNRKVGDEYYTLWLATTLADSLLSSFDIVEKGTVENLTAERDRYKEVLEKISHTVAGGEIKLRYMAREALGYKQSVVQLAGQALSPEPEKVDEEK